MSREFSASIRLIAALLLLALAIPGIASAQVTFPIGLYEAGVMPKWFRLTSNEQPCADSDTSCYAPQWSNFEEVRGDTGSASVYGYTSGFNIIVGGGKPTDNGMFSFEDSECALTRAQELGFQLLVPLTFFSDPYDAARLDSVSYFQRDPPVLQPSIDLIMQVKDHPALYGWFIVDEPNDFACEHNVLGQCDDRFHMSNVSPARLKVVYDSLRAVADDEHPYIVPLPDYDEPAYNREPWGESGPQDWRWNNDSPDTLCFFDPHDPQSPARICATQDYTESVDIIHEDTYLAKVGWEEGWVDRLEALDGLADSKPGAAHITLDCRSDASGNRYSLDELRFQAFSAIIHGMTGVWFWSYYQTFDTPDRCVSSGNGRIQFGPASSHFVENIVPLSNELSELGDFLAGTDLGSYRWGSATGDIPAVSDSAIHCVLRQSGDSFLVLVANTGAYSTEFSLDFSQLDPVLSDAVAARRMLGVGGSPSYVPVNAGWMQDELEPYSVQAYRFGGTDWPFPGDAVDLQTAIDNAAPGDRVLVQPNSQDPNGAWETTLELRPGVIVEAAPGSEAPVIDADGEHTAVVCGELGGFSAAIRGLVIRGFASEGIAIDSAANGSLRVEDCVIEIGPNASNSAIAINGTAGAFSGRQLTVRSTRIESAKTSGFPVGIRWTHSSQIDSVDVVVENCTIVQNPPLESGIGFVAVSPAGHHRIVGNTISGFGAGVWASLGNYQTWYRATGLLERNVLVENEIGADLAGNITSRRNVAWNVTDNYSPSYYGDSSLVADPRLCDSTLSLNATSPCLPANNPWDVWVGSSREVACASGVLGTDFSTRLLTLDLAAIPSGRLNLTSDLKVASGRSLTLTGDIAVMADSLDEANSGLYSQGNEIVVEGTLTISGSSQAPATFRSGVSSPIAGSWGGFYVKNGGDLRLSDVDVRHGTYGVLAVGLADTVSLVDTSIDSCQQMLVSVNNACLPTPCPTTNVSITGGEFRMRTATHGIHLLKPESVVIDGAAIIGTSSGFYGILADTAGTSSQTLIQNCVVEDLSTGTGIYVNADSPSLKSNRVVDCKWGIQLRGSGTPVISRVSGSGPGTQLTRCTTGLYVQSASASVDSVSVKPGGVSGATGVQNSGNSGGAYTKLHVVGGNVAFNATSTATPAPTLRGSRLVDFTVNGTKHNGTGGLDLGTSSSEGLNRIESSSASGKWVSVKTCPSGGATLPARSNYWGGTPDPADFSSCVDYADWLSTDPTQPSAVQISVEAVPTRPFQATPNPFTGGVRLGFSVERPGPIQVRIFDVAGRLVRSVVESDLNAGAYEREWDGRDEEGRSTPAGIYFARLIEPGRVRAIKLVRLP